MDIINTIDLAHQDFHNEEQVQLFEDTIYQGMSEEEALASIDQQIKRWQDYWGKKELSKRQEMNIKYYIGDQVDKTALREDIEKSVENDIFRNIETIVPIATSRTPELTITAAYKNDQIADFTNDATRVLQAEWEIHQHMQKIVSQMIRNHQMLFLAIAKVGIDPDTGKRQTQQIVATDCIISKDGSFVAQYIKDKTLGDLINLFPEKEQAILKQFGVSLNKMPKGMADSPIEYIEVWDNNTGTVAWKFKNCLLAIERMPHFDYDGIVPQPKDPATGQPVPPPTDQQGNPIKVKYNYFDRPRHPFIFLTYANRGIDIFDDTTLLEQAIGPQDWINKRKRQIGMNADSTNGHWVSSGDFIAEEEFQKLEGGVNEKIWLEKGLPKDGFVKITGEGLPPMVFQDLSDSRSALDNIMGTHDVSRGERTGSKTLGQDMIQKDQDYGRVDGYVRDGIEVFAQQWFEYMYHLYLVYEDKKNAIAVVQDDDYEDDTIYLCRSEVPLIQMEDGQTVPIPISLQVKQGSTLPRDEVAEYQRAIQAKDELAPIDFFKLMGVPNPKKLYKNLLMHQLDPYNYFFSQDKDVQQALQQKQQQKPTLNEPPRMNIAISADANTPEGSALLEQQGLLPPGASQVSASREVGQHAAEVQSKQAEQTHQASMELMKQAGIARQNVQQHLHDHRTQAVSNSHAMMMAGIEAENKAQLQREQAESQLAQTQAQSQTQAQPTTQAAS